LQVKLKSCVAVEVLVTVGVSILVLFRFYKSNVVWHWNKLNCKERCLSSLFLGDEIMNCFDVIPIGLRWRQSMEGRRNFCLCMSDSWLRRAANFHRQSNMWRWRMCFMNETKIMCSLVEQSRYYLRERQAENRPESWYFAGENFFFWIQLFQNKGRI
jgi:hypothetical protein